MTEGGSGWPGAPADWTASVGYGLTYDIEGFPNQSVEGWETMHYGGMFHRGSLGIGIGGSRLVSYGAVMRSPWTRLGWPWIATQDLRYEPKQLKTWFEGLSGEEPGLVADDYTRYKMVPD